MKTIITNIDKLRVREMGDISKNFSRSEFCCKCCDFSAVDVKLIEVLEIVRAQFKKPVKITSACRCEVYNYVVGGADNSKHKLGMAADIIVKDVDPGKVYEFLDLLQPNKYGIGSYKTFTHIDVREDKARWKG